MTLWKLKWYYERFCKLLIRCPGCPLPYHFLVIALVWGKTQLDTVFYRLAYLYIQNQSQGFFIGFHFIWTSSWLLRLPIGKKSADKFRNEIMTFLAQCLDNWGTCIFVWRRFSSGCKRCIIRYPHSESRIFLINIAYSWCVYISHLFKTNLSTSTGIIRFPLVKITCAYLTFYLLVSY